MAPQNSTLLHENVDFNALDLSPIKHSKTIKDDVAEISSLRSSDVYEIIESVKSMNRFSKLSGSQVDDEIPIWILGEPRFISGITNTTTCKHLIQALIDDELNSSSADVAASRELSDYVITEKWRDVEQALPGDTKILPIWMAWGSARHEVKFKLKINKNKAETETVDIHHNDNRNANHNDKRHKELEELRRRKAIHVSQLLKRLIDQGESIKAQLNHLKEGKHRSDPRKNFLLESFLRDAAQHQCQITLPDVSTKNPTKIHPKSDHQPIESKTENPIIPVKCARNRITTTATATSIPDDELFLVIDDKSGDGDSENDSAVHVEYRQYYLNKKLQIATAKANVNGMTETKVHRNEMTTTTTTTKKRESISKIHEFDEVQRKRFNKRLIKYLSDDFNQRVPKHCTEPSYQLATTGLNSAIHHEIDQLLQELHELIALEEHLMKGLSIKCEQYHTQNNKYMTKLERLELSVDEIQNNLDVYAKEIIDNELELYKIQNEIRKKCGILCNLQRMVGKTNENDGVERKQESMIKPKNMNHSRVNNIDDSGTFFDSTNNKSIII